MMAQHLKLVRRNSQSKSKRKTNDRHTVVWQHIEKCINENADHLLQGYAMVTFRQDGTSGIHYHFAGIDPLDFPDIVRNRIKRCMDGE